VVEYLLRNHASLKTVDSFGRTALHHATTDDVKTLLHSARGCLDDRRTCWLPGDDVTASQMYVVYSPLLVEHLPSFSRYSFSCLSQCSIGILSATAWRGVLSGTVFVCLLVG